MSIAVRLILVMVILAGGAWISEKQKHGFICYCIGALLACLAVVLDVMNSRTY